MGWTGAWLSEYGVASALRFFKKSGDLTEPSRFFTFQDMHPRSICGPIFLISMLNPEHNIIASYPFLDHNQGGVVSFADGHVEWHRWVDPRTLHPASQSFQDFHRHDDMTPNNPDVEWLKYHATILDGSAEKTSPGLPPITGW